MFELQYPKSKKFIKKGMKLINNGEPVKILINKSRYIKKIKECESFFVEQVVPDDVSSWSIISLNIYFFRLMVLHYYSVSNGYFLTIEYENNACYFQYKAE